MVPSHTLRPETATDGPFLLRLYASTREQEMRAVPWSPEEKDAFVRQQFAAQQRHCAAHYAGDSLQIVEVDGEAVGRLYTGRRSDEIRIIDISLLPGFRGRGIGSALLGEILHEAQSAGLAVRLHVEHNNPAVRLYSRHGFVTVADHGVYWLMERPRP